MLHNNADFLLPNYISDKASLNLAFDCDGYAGDNWAFFLAGQQLMDIVCFGQTESLDGSTRLTTDILGEYYESFKIIPAQISSSVDQIVFVRASEFGKPAGVYISKDTRICLTDENTNVLFQLQAEVKNEDSYLAKRLEVGRLIRVDSKTDQANWLFRARLTSHKTAGIESVIAKYGEIVE